MTDTTHSFNQTTLNKQVRELRESARAEIYAVLGEHAFARGGTTDPGFYAGWEKAFKAFLGLEEPLRRIFNLPDSPKYPENNPDLIEELNTHPFAHEQPTTEKKL